MQLGTDTTARLGIAAADTFFSKHDWLFREQTIHDWGIDAQVEPKENGRPTGKLIALQIKTGPSFFKRKSKDAIRHSISDSHLDYWLRHQLPVFIILHDNTRDETIWQKVERHLIDKTSSGNWYIDIPTRNRLDKRSLRFIEKSIAKDPTSFRRSLLALDYPIMQRVQRGPASLRVLEMNHKGLSFRGAWLRFGDADKPSADLTLERWAPSDSIHDYMATMFPWLDYLHAEPLEDPLGSIEAEEHKLRVKLNDVGQAFCSLENFYLNGKSPLTYPLQYREDDTFTEDEYSDWAFNRALGKDNT
ncbi:DUF4365 domain-containing protein [Rhizobium laguerreae]|uniref:DUF4365 domain-containing protein n=1 Tax=Rhizobium laguerreae TaxID=1076926 RepID=UPI001C91740A|nr:DUF4365 domain-containing protein [Rhizobium laguerreae]MBY3389215.1 DUF4365 domain-containing protein [Rhizobium laguerreae]MBY3402966.1 DUF4365 domain-containing protein [Rhizobium laguerreae]MBY3409905.1 DUF4365 domain-containing protein [Rhizobium laguerreae]